MAFASARFITRTVEAGSTWGQSGIGIELWQPNARDGFNPEGGTGPAWMIGNTPGFVGLFQDPDFAQRYADRWGELRTNQFADRQNSGPSR